MPVFQCDVCLGEGQPPAVVLQCGHTFHSQCMLRWVKSQNELGSPHTCPVCRASVTIPNINTPQPQREEAEYATPVRAEAATAGRIHSSSESVQHFTFRAPDTIIRTQHEDYMTVHATALHVIMPLEAVPNLLNAMCRFIDRRISHPLLRLQDRAPVTFQLLDSRQDDDQLLRNPVVVSELRAVAEYITETFLEREREREREEEGQRERERLQVTVEEYHTDEEEFMGEDEE
jgi:hypothetical protein